MPLSPLSGWQLRLDRKASALVTAGVDRDLTSHLARRGVESTLDVLRTRAGIAIPCGPTLLAVRRAAPGRRSDEVTCETVRTQCCLDVSACADHECATGGERRSRRQQRASPGSAPVRGSVPAPLAIDVDVLPA